MHCQISPRTACNICGDTMKMSSRYHRLLIYDVKCTTKIDGMGPFKNAITLEPNKLKLVEAKKAVLPIKFGMIKQLK